MATHVQPVRAGQKERWGRFVLLAETEQGPWGTEYRAAQIGAAGFERLVGLIRFEPGFPAAAVDLMAAQARAAMKVGGPGILPLIDGQGDEGWLAHEYVAGRSLGAVIARGREEGMPLALDNALQVGRQVGIALERTHAQHKDDGGGPLIHGLLTPWSVVVSYEGAVHLRGFGLWSSRSHEGRLPAEQAGVLAPEQLEGHADARSDVYGLATLMLTCLGGGLAARGADLAGQLAELRQIDDEPLPEALVHALTRALSPRAADRQSTVAELRREIEMVLFSNDLTTTTFNLAFFMQTLFRQTVDDEAKAASRESQAAFYAPEPAAESVAPAVPVPPALPAVPDASTAAAEIVSTPYLPDTAAIVAEVVDAPAPAPHEPTTQRRAVHGRRDGDQKSRGLLIGGALLLVGLAVGGFFFMKGRRDAAARAAATPTTLSPEAQAAVARVQELEARLKALEDERLQAEATAAQAEKDRLEAEAKAKGKKVDPQALAKAQEDAARKAREQQEKQQKEELARLEKQRREQQAQLAAVTPVTLPPAPPPTAAAAPITTPAASVKPPEPAPINVSAAAPTPAPVAAASLPPPTTPTAAAPTGGAAVPAGGVHEMDEPGLLPPSVLKESPVEYPLIARTGRITGGVMVTAVVDETGKVTQARAVSGNAVLRKPAVDQVSSRVYRPARKDGVTVKVRITVLVTFKG